MLLSLESTYITQWQNIPATHDIILYTNGRPLRTTRLIDSINPKILSKSNRPMNGNEPGLFRLFYRWHHNGGDQEELISGEVAKMFLNAYISSSYLMLSMNVTIIKSSFPGQRVSNIVRPRTSRL